MLTNTIALRYHWNIQHFSEGNIFWSKSECEGAKKKTEREKQEKKVCANRIWNEIYVRFFSHTFFSVGLLKKDPSHLHNDPHKNSNNNNKSSIVNEIIIKMKTIIMFIMASGTVCVAISRK